MNKETLTALENSIAHWKRMATGKAWLHEIPDADSCALCGLFIRQSCVGCPVSKKTGHNICRATPYQAAEAAWGSHGQNSQTFKRAARKQITSLKSLLPKKKPLTKRGPGSKSKP